MSLLPKNKKTKIKQVIGATLFNAVTAAGATLVQGGRPTGLVFLDPVTRAPIVVIAREQETFREANRRALLGAGFSI